MESQHLNMVNITHKQNTYRIAIATAEVRVSEPATISAINEKRVPKGDVLECSRVAGLLGVKNTSSVIPDCHPLPVEYTSIRHSIDGLAIRIEVEVHTIYKTGVEVEAMHGAAVAALTMYDMLKPIDKGVVIGEIKLQQKKGGKSDRAFAPGVTIRTAVVVCSDSVAAGDAEDISGKTAMALLEEYSIPATHYSVIADDPQAITSTCEKLVNDGYNLVLLSGGTGAGPRDITPETVSAIIDRPMPGIMEHARSYGQSYTPYSMLSRGIAGFAGNTLLITLPGSPKAVTENMRAIFPHVLHVFSVNKGGRHDESRNSNQ
ncbi:bifunctional molybdenum cofactor biosynthesis protein MoaC/MoaB [Flavihumibacter solisilvae]|nr:bifunctional molybdenum cofactor biosynthesis protein MoaC/MoaB [Flavihumibacter solisilvae]